MRPIGVSVVEPITVHSAAAVVKTQRHSTAYMYYPEYRSFMGVID